MSTAADQRKRTASLRALHQPGHPVILPNVWDAASARAVQAAGFPAVATASAAIAPTLGYDDHEAAPHAEMFAAAARIARAVSVPVTVDAEGGYGLPPDELVERVLDTGAVGCNLEDTDHRTGELIDPAEHAHYLKAVRSAAGSAGGDLVINARIDVFLHHEADPVEHIDDAVRRGRHYLAAGADCVYPILATGEHTVSTLVDAIDGPVNILHRDTDDPEVLTVPELAELNVARVSFGPGVYRAVHTKLARMLDHLAAGEDPHTPA